MPLLQASHLDRDLEADVCVVGSGPAGAVVATLLADRGREVLLLERGDVDARRDPMPARILPDAIGHDVGVATGLGGTSALWSGRMAPLEPFDLAERPWVPGSGWPIRHAELAAYYGRAASILGIGSLWPTFQRQAQRQRLAVTGPLAADRGVLEPRPFAWAVPGPFRAAAYLDAAMSRAPNLTVVVAAHADEIEVSADGSTATGVRILDEIGRGRTIRAEQIVLATGGLQTPSLLLRSDTVLHQGLGNETGNVGRHLATHPKGDVGLLTLREPLAADHPLLHRARVADGEVGFGVAVTPRTQTSERLLDHYVQFLPRRALPHRVARRAGAALPKYGPGVVRRLEARPVSQLLVRVFLDEYPDVERRVAPSERRDGSGPARITWRWTRRDGDALVAFLDVVARAFADSGTGRLTYDADAVASGRMLTGVHSHFLGTTRMASHPRTGVVDRDCRVFGTENLYVAGPSVFSTPGNANPMLTIVALALRLADHLTSED